MKLMTDEQLSALVEEATIKLEKAHASMAEIMGVIEQRDEEGHFTGCIDYANYRRYHKDATSLYEIAHEILVDVEQRPSEQMDVFNKAVEMVTLSFQIMSSAEVTYRRYCNQKGIAISKLTDYLHIPRQTLTVWRQLVDDNPKDLAPRMDAYLKEDA